MMNFTTEMTLNYSHLQPIMDSFYGICTKEGRIGKILVL